MFIWRCAWTFVFGAVFLAGLPRAVADPVPGLVVKFESPDGKSIDMREARLVALTVPAGEHATPFLPVGPFKATFSGNINLKLRDQFTFSAAGRGEFELIVNGQSVLKCAGDDLSGKTSEIVKLTKGANQLIAHYTAPTDGDAMIRLSWAGKNGEFDPIPPTVFTHDVDAALAERLQLREGRSLVATMRCVRCHAMPEDGTAGKEAMPELSSDAPALDEVGSRLNAQWMAKWIGDPKSLRAEATMPRLFAAGKEGEQAAEDIAAYLATRKSSNDLTKTEAMGNEASVTAGAQLFAALGCIACHTPPGAKKDVARISLRFVAAKYRPPALIEFLKRPEAHYAWIRMPDFSLSDEEAAKLAAFLLHDSPADAMQAINLDGADAARGKELFEKSGCTNCHAPQEKSAMQANAIAELKKEEDSKGCLAADEKTRGRAPDFAFTDEQRAAIRSFAQSDWTSLRTDAAAEFAERSVQSLNCTACHTRDGQQDRWTQLAPEIAAFQSKLPPAPARTADQQRPVLTWVGERLQTNWMADFIAGKVDFKPRPWLQARMPAFPSRAQMIAQGLCFQHGLPLKETPEAPIETDLAAIGKKLSGRVGGFSCNQCHAINQTPALVPFDSPAPNFMYASERLRKDFYKRWVYSPQKYQPNTRMPTYADGEGKTPYKDILGGDARKQFESIWQYLRTGRAIVPPE